MMTLRGTRSTRLFLFIAGTSVLAGAAGYLAWAGGGGAEHPWRIDDPVVRAMNRGVGLMGQYSYEEALKAFEEAVRLAPELTEARLNMAIARFNRNAKGDLEAAQKLLDEILRKQPDHAPALYFRAVIHQYGGEDDKALPLFERVAKLAPDDGYVWYLLARSKEHLGQPCRAELEKAVEANPTLSSAYYQLMREATRAGDRAQAKAYQETFVRLKQSLLSDIVTVPEYQRMGPLAIAQQIRGAGDRAVTSGELVAGETRALATSGGSLTLQGAGEAERGTAAGKVLAAFGVPIAAADVNGDGRLDIVTTATVRDGQRAIAVLLGGERGTFVDATDASGIAGVRGAIACALGDYDNDDAIDLFVACAGPNHLFRGKGDGTFEDVTGATGTAGGDAVTASAVFLDADHDADLDLYVCNVSAADESSPAANQLLNNNADGTFVDIAADAGVACAGRRSVMLAPADLDNDRDTDLIVFHVGAPASVFLNDRASTYHEGALTAEPLSAPQGGIAQDFNGDGRADLAVFPGPDSPGHLYLSDGTGTLKPSSQFDGVVKALASWGSAASTRVVDVDLDGDLDMAVFGANGHVLLNDGRGRFVLKTDVWPAKAGTETAGVLLMDGTGDGVPDAVRFQTGSPATIELTTTTLTPPAHWLAVTPTGDRGADKRTRSPASGFGTRMELRAGVHEQTIFYTGLDGGLGQSRTPWIFGLDGASEADLLAFTWPDGVSQSEIELTADTHHAIRELDRRVSSCPVLFTWNGERFEFITDFAGVGGLGYLVAPGEYAPPRALEHVKIEPGQLTARDGRYELRICEPMEEVAYIDRLELLAVDHPRDHRVFPDERLAISGPPPTHQLLCVKDRIFPTRATAPGGTDCTDSLTRVDRIYAYQPKLDRRFIGFCEPHTLVLEFDDRLSALPPGRPVYLFVNGWIEYPYSQTTFAAGQARVAWQPTRIEREVRPGQWDTIAPDAGAPGGMGRMITVDLTGKLPADACRLRITTNLEVYYDQMFLAADLGQSDVTIQSVPLKQAAVRRLGFPLEYSPDGRLPMLYSYDIIQATSPFKVPRGRYTRYGPVEDLLGAFDDRYVILGTGDEIAASFDGTALRPLTDGQTRSFVLVSHAYCKDMDLYTAEPDTVEPLPFRGMRNYPYPAGQAYPAGPSFDRYHARYNTRVVD